VLPVLCPIAHPSEEGNLTPENDDADFAETAGYGFAATLAFATSRDLRINDLGTLSLPEVVAKESGLVASVSVDAKPDPASSVSSASSLF
jgi:hypothetical protein